MATTLTLPLHADVIKVGILQKEKLHFCADSTNILTEKKTKKIISDTKETVREKGKKILNLLS